MGGEKDQEKGTERKEWQNDKGSQEPLGKIPLSGRWERRGVLSTKDCEKKEV